MKTYPAKIVGSILILTAFLAVSFFFLRGNTSEARVAAAIASLKNCEAIQLDAAAQFDRSERYKCYQDVLRGNVRKYGLSASSAAFDLYVQEPQSPIRGGTCHALGHDLGEAALQEKYTSADILTYCSSVCEGGCFNGVGHSYVVTHRLDLSGMDEFCSPPEYEGPKERVAACYHGFGHGITDVFGPDVENGLALCKNIKNDEGRYQCGHAVFMLFSSLPADRVRETAKLPKDFASFCKEADSAYQQSCYTFSGYLTYAGSEDVNKAAEVCLRAPEKLKKECLQRIGEAVFSSSTPTRMGDSAVICGNIENNAARLLCVFGIATTSVTATNTNPNDTFDVCSSVALSVTDQKSCHIEMAGGIKGVRGEAAMVKYCELVPEAWRVDCLNLKRGK